MKHIPVIQIDQVLIPTDIITDFFCCDLDACKGACCIEGDAGAPLTLDEALQLEDLLSELEPEMSEVAKKIVKEQGVSYVDQEGDLVTSIVDNKDCVFTCYGEEGCCYCAAEKAYRKRGSGFCKPISCYLYPIREHKLSNGMVALNYHRWDVCKDAVKKGTALKLPIYKFLKDPLITRFGKEWYTALDSAAEEFLKESQG